MTKQNLPKGLSIVEYTTQDNREATIAKLYDTNIVILDINNTVKLNSNNFRTNHTKKCTNLVLNKYNIPLHLYQKDFIWYVASTKTNKTLQYTDNMIIKISDLY